MKDVATATIVILTMQFITTAANAQLSSDIAQNNIDRYDKLINIAKLHNEVYGRLLKQKDVYQCLFYLQSAYSKSSLPICDTLLTNSIANGDLGTNQTVINDAHIWRRGELNNHMNTMDIKQ
jgi:hypothetical protein